MSHNLLQTLKTTLDYYRKHQHFSGDADEDWMRQLQHFTELAEYDSYSSAIDSKKPQETRASHFQYSLEPSTRSS